MQYFEKILDHCRRNSVTAFLCMLPIRPKEPRAYKDGEMEEFRTFLFEYVDENTHLLDFTYDDGYVTADYTDITHFNEAAADRFSAQLDGTIHNVLDRTDRRQMIAGRPEETAAL